MLSLPELGLVQSGHSGAKLLQLGEGAERRRAAAGMWDVLLLPFMAELSQP